MRHTVTTAVLLTALSFVPASASADGMRVSVRPGQEVRTCDDLEVSFDGRAAVRSVDRLTAPGAQKLAVQAARNGGVYVWGGSRSEFAITVCKAAAHQASLDHLRAGLGGGTLTATGPASSDWVVYFIVDAPARASIELESTNGPLQVAHVTGSTTARAKNGPIKLLDVSGRVSAKAENGPIAYDGASGTVELATENGPLAVRLAVDKWADGTLTASAQNGPVKLQVPPAFASGVRVRSSQHSPWNCRGCGNARRTWDDGSRSIEFGSGPVAVTLSTVNGPVAVDQSR
jgi:hypothetical protein